MILICLGVVLLMRSTMGYDWCSVRLDGPCVFHLIGNLEHHAIATTLRIQGDLTATSCFASTPYLRLLICPWYPTHLVSWPLKGTQTCPQPSSLDARLGPAALASAPGEQFTQTPTFRTKECALTLAQPIPASLPPCSLSSFQERSQFSLPSYISHRPEL